MHDKNDTVGKTIKTGISFGSALAMVISYTTWHSVGWANELGLCNLFYLEILTNSSCEYNSQLESSLSLFNLPSIFDEPN